MYASERHKGKISLSSGELKNPGAANKKLLKTITVHKTVRTT
jgi:hypothetical protein